MVVALLAWPIGLMLADEQFTISCMEETGNMLRSMVIRVIARKVLSADRTRIILIPLPAGGRDDGQPHQPLPVGDPAVRAVVSATAHEGTSHRPRCSRSLSHRQR